MQIHQLEFYAYPFMVEISAGSLIRRINDGVNLIGVIGYVREHGIITGLDIRIFILMYVSRNYCP